MQIRKCIFEPHGDDKGQPNSMWREMFDFSPDAVLMVLASELYDEKDLLGIMINFWNSLRLVMIHP